MLTPPPSGAGIAAGGSRVADVAGSPKATGAQAKHKLNIRLTVPGRFRDVIEWILARQGVDGGE